LYKLKLDDIFSDMVEIIAAVKISDDSYFIKFEGVYLAHSNKILGFQEN